MRERKDKYRRAVAAAAILLAGSVILVSSCSEDVYVGDGSENQKPNIWLSSGPPEGEITDYVIRFDWFAYDRDGAIEYYEYACLSGDPIGFDPADTALAETWTRTTDSRVDIRVSADSLGGTVYFNTYPYDRYVHDHTFFVRAIDDRGARSDPAVRSFTAFTLAPSVTITDPVFPNPDRGAQMLPPTIRFHWQGKDPIDSPWNYQDIDSVRYMTTLFYQGIVDDLNGKPEKFEEKWTPWIWRHAPEDSGASTVIGDDEIITFGKTYIFALQAKDEAGAISSIYSIRSNVRVFMCRMPTGPILQVDVPGLGSKSFIGTRTKPLQIMIPSGFPLTVSWLGDASDYGGLVSGYRYGWDIEDYADPSEWSVGFNLNNRSIPPVRFYSGAHTLSVESIDNLGISTVAIIEFTVVPSVMDRNLLFVDDFELPENFMYYALPTEEEHTVFWMSICDRAKGFVASRDVYVTAEHAYFPPDLDYLWRYKNVLWLDGGARREFCTWKRLYAPRSADDDRAGYTDKYSFNVLDYYLRLGGHVWVVLRGDGRGQLAGSVGHFPIEFPDYRGSKDHFCVQILDQVSGPFYPYPNLPYRDVSIDALSYMRRANNVVTGRYKSFPARVDLRPEVVQSGSYFDPAVRGFTYVEMYDPPYWMRNSGLTSSLNFNPIYLNMTVSSRSAVRHAPVAFFSTAFESVVGEAPGCVGAPNVVFGLPLWFFREEQVDSIADAVFSAWQIRQADEVMPD